MIFHHFLRFSIWLSPHFPWCSMVLPIFCAKKYQKMHPTSIFFNLRPRLTDASQGSVPLVPMVPMVPVASTATSASSGSESGESGGGAPGKKLGASRGLQVPWANWSFSHGSMEKIWKNGRKSSWKSCSHPKFFHFSMWFNHQKLWENDGKVEVILTKKGGAPP